LSTAQERLVERAQLIQRWFEREQRQLQDKQAWFQNNQVRSLQVLMEFGVFFDLLTFASEPPMHHSFFSPVNAPSSIHAAESHHT
jgi:hypothetical protein